LRFGLFSQHLKIYKKPKYKCIITNFYNYCNVCIPVSQLSRASWRSLAFFGSLNVEEKTDFGGNGRSTFITVCSRSISLNLVKPTAQLVTTLEEG
jgi:hypothetical protein